MDGHGEATSPKKTSLRREVDVFKRIKKIRQ
jgi:hypothetical protein